MKLDGLLQLPWVIQRTLREARGLLEDLERRASELNHRNYNRNGGLTLVPMPGFEKLAEELRRIIEKKKRKTHVDIVIPEFGYRQSKEPFIRLPKEHIGGHDCVVLTSGPGTPEMLINLYNLLGYLSGRRAGRISVITGYFPLSRSDKDEGDLELALTPHVVHLMKCSAYGKLDRIIAVDLHSPQVVMAGGNMGLITPVSLARRVFKRVLQDALQKTKKVCVLLPDDGAAKQYEDVVLTVSKELGVTIPVISGVKRRDDSRQSRLMYLQGPVDELQDSLVICLDDEAATVGTQNGTAEHVKDKYGANLFWAALIHGVLCGSAASLLSDADCKIDKMYVTDTIPIKNRANIRGLLDTRLRVIPWLDDLANVVYYHHWDTSIRERR